VRASAMRAPAAAQGVVGMGPRVPSWVVWWSSRGCAGRLGEGSRRPSPRVSGGSPGGVSEGPVPGVPRRLFRGVSEGSFPGVSEGCFEGSFPGVSAPRPEGSRRGGFRARRRGRFRGVGRLPEGSAGSRTGCGTPCSCESLAVMGVLARPSSANSSQVWGFVARGVECPEQLSHVERRCRRGVPDAAGGVTLHRRAVSGVQVQQCNRVPQNFCCTLFET
jgi:hypothetical protein